MPKSGKVQLLLPILLLGFAATLPGQDTYCPVYSRGEQIQPQRIITELRYTDYAGDQPGSKNAITLPPARNVIDEWIFRKLSQDGVEPAPMTTDNEFLRRIYLDLTGRIPTLEQADAFLNGRTQTRAQVIEQLLASPEYVDQISHWFLERFRVGTRTDAWISISARNNFYSYIREFVQQDRPYNRVVSEMLTASGDSDIEPALGLLTRQITDYYGSTNQDFWDDFTNLATTEFLGFRTECISCHDGQRHLENINLFLTPRTRREFWRLSAFFSRTRVQVVNDDNADNRQRLLFFDSSTGLYNGAINPSRPGPRPSRGDANEEPHYWFTDQKPSTGSWRSEFAQKLTSDRQFARASVNYVWAYFFGNGIVDPPDGWDLARVNPNVPPPAGWPIQNSHPELLEALTDLFIQSNYSTKNLIRLIVNSSTYQLSGRYPEGKWQDAFRRYYARYEARRMTAEQIFDSLTTATGTEPWMAVSGLPNLLRYANQIPAPWASSDWDTENFLDSLGRGDWMNRQSSNQSTVLGSLDLMNRWTVNVRTRSWSDRWTRPTRLSTGVAQGLSDDELIRRLFLATLTRYPTPQEFQIVRERKQSDRVMWLTGLQWVLLQKSDFLFKY
jgi:hypothetical protein